MFFLVNGFNCFSLSIEKWCFSTVITENLKVEIHTYLTEQTTSHN